jgi:hypothetical protein
MSNREAEFICSVLRSFVREAVAPPVPPGLAWDRVERLAARNLVMPILLDVLNAEVIPATVRQRWEPLVIGTEIHHARAQRAAAKLCRILEAEGIPSVVLRGMALTSWVYRDPALRPMVDVDVLIPAEARYLLTEVLAWHGIEPAKTLRSQIVYCFEGVVFEIHWSLLTPKRYRRIGNTSLWIASRIKIPLDDGMLFRLSSENELLDLVCHSFIHHELRNLLQAVDIAMVSNLEGIDWQYVFEWCRNARVTRLVWFVLSFVDRLFDLGLVARLASLGISYSGLKKSGFEAYQCRLFGEDSRLHHLRRKANLIAVAESPVVRLRQMLRFLSLDEIGSIIRPGA